MLTTGSKVFFCGPGMTLNDRDLYSAKRAAGDLSFRAPTAITELNTAAKESTLWISPDGLMLIFGRDVSDTQTSDLDMYIATRIDRNAPFGTATEIPETRFLGLARSPPMGSVCTFPPIATGSLICGLRHERPETVTSTRSKARRKPRRAR